MTTDRFPTRTGRVPETAGRGPLSGFRTTDRVPTRGVEPAAPSRATSGYRSSGIGSSGSRTGRSDRDGFYRPAVRAAPSRVADTRYDRHDRYDDRDRYQHSHRSVVVTHNYGHYDRSYWRDWDWRGSFGFYVGFSWPYYYGYSRVSYSYGNHYWPFWYTAPICVAYVPFGFYVDREPVLVRETIIVEQPIIIEREVPVVVTERGTVYEEGALVKTAEYREPIAGGPAGTSDVPPTVDESEPAPPPVFDEATERYLREGSEAFARGDYQEAAKSFRFAVVANPNAAPPKFAFGQALIAIRDYAYASRVLREALTAEPEILNAPGSIVGVYSEPEEFYRVLSELKTARLENPDDPDLLFLVVYEQYFSGDVQAVITFDRLRNRFPGDPAVQLFAPALAERFPDFAKYPEPGAQTTPK